MRLFRLISIAGLLFNLSAFAQKTSGTLLNEGNVQKGYTLFTSLNTKNTYLIDNCGNVINKWQSEFASGSTAYLMSNGYLLRAAKIPNEAIDRAGGGGRLEMMNWDSKIVWSFDYNTTVVRQHHDILPMENGNILVLAWQSHTGEEAIAAGRNPGLLPDGVVWGEEIVEVKPVLPEGFEIVWRWSAWDHLVQEFDQTKNNFGVVSQHPELINLNFVQGNGNRDWIHGNSLAYNPELNQIMVCTPFFNEFWIIDHSTTTAQAATHSGGNSNKGGDLLYRWGNPRTYNQGTPSDQKLFGPHHAHWIKKGLPSAGSIMVFNNNAGNGFSAIEIIESQATSTGAYQLVNGRYGPATAKKTITANPPKNLYSANMSGVEMQPNGNLLICTSQQGRFVELTSSLDTAWLYKSPITPNGIAGKDFTPANSNFTSDPSFRAEKYPPNFSGLAGKDLTPGSPLESSTDEGAVDCDPVAGLSQFQEARLCVYPNPVKDYIFIEASAENISLDVRLIDLQGREITCKQGTGSVRVNLTALTDGIFIVSVNGKSTRMLKQSQP